MANETNIILIVLVTSLIFFLLVLAIIAFTALYSRKLVKKDNELKLAIKNRQLAVLRAVIETQTSERGKIANNLHDEVGPLLSTMKLRFFQNQKDFKEGKVSDETFKEDRVFLDTIIQIVRKVSHDLSPQFVTKFGLVKAVENFVKDLNGIQTEFSCTLDPNHEVPTIISDNLYYILTELINNLIKHENIRDLKIAIRLKDDVLYSTIIHDGIGYTDEEFDIFEQNSQGLGLTSIKSRAIVIGSELMFRKSPNSPHIEIATPLTLE